jgi:hypothetical protein
VNLFDSSEQGLAAYLGFNNVSALRTLALSWPVLRIFFLFFNIRESLNKSTAFRLLHADEAKWAETYPLQSHPLLELARRKTEKLK